MVTGGSGWIDSKYFSTSIEFVRHDLGSFDLSRSWYDITKIKGLGYELKTDLVLGISCTIFDLQEGR